LCLFVYYFQILYLCIALHHVMQYFATSVASKGRVVMSSSCDV